MGEPLEIQTVVLEFELNNLDTKLIKWGSVQVRELRVEKEIRIHLSLMGQNGPTKPKTYANYVYKRFVKVTKL